MDKKGVTKEYIYWFSDIDKNNKEVGNKALILSELYKKRFPIPLGFVISSKAFIELLKIDNTEDKIKDLIENTNITDFEELEKISNQIENLIKNLKLSKELENEIIEAYHILSSENLITSGLSRDALNILKNSNEPIFISVRSSGISEDSINSSFAGQNESYLNVKGDRKIIEAIKKCYISLYSPRSIYYRKIKGIKESSMAIIIQKMVDSKKSGVIFSKDPINQKNNLIIESIFGFGEGLLSGKVNPDKYIIENEKIISSHIGDKKIAIVRSASGDNEMVRLNHERGNSPVLNNSQINKLTKYALDIENIYNSPQDIEFAIDDDEIFIIQARPLLMNNTDKKIQLSGKQIIKGIGSSPGVVSGNIRLIKGRNDINDLKKGEIIVAENAIPEIIVLMNKCSGIIADSGGITSHLSLIARELNIPMIVSTTNAITKLENEKEITIDGTEGIVYEGDIIPLNLEIPKEENKIEINEAIETNRIKISLLVNNPKELYNAKKTKIRQIGLVKIEKLISEKGKHPIYYEKNNKFEEYTELIEHGIVELIDSFDRIFIRTSDIRTDEYEKLKDSPQIEKNPLFGEHGIRFSLKHPRLFESELEAIRRVAERYENKEFGVIIPQIVSIDEIRKSKQFFNESKTDNMEFGILIETPSSVQIIEDICIEKVDYIIVDCDDLMKYTLAYDNFDENNDFIAESHPALFSQLKRVIGSARRYKIESSICGKAVYNEEMLDFLAKKGITSVTVIPEKAYEVSKTLKNLEENHLDKINEEKEIIQKSDNIKEENPIEENKELLEIREDLSPPNLGDFIEDVNDVDNYIPEVDDILKIQEKMDSVIPDISLEEVQDLEKFHETETTFGDLQEMIDNIEVPENTEEEEEL
ncbi:MAG: PEP/pyruvate-binding domain-containing protein [Candidatus Pacearchaeota archaeon]|jgi:pyruvate,water dikinase